MSDNASRRGAADLGMPLMILAFLVIGGFMFWLNGQAAAEKQAQADAAAALLAAEEAENAAATVETVAIGDIEVDPTPFVGTKLRSEGAVASMLGGQGFWLATPSGNPFLVSWSEELLAEGASVGMGDTIAVEGVVTEMEPLTLVEWSTAQTISETDRIIAEFATHYIAADRVDILRGEGGDGEGDEGSEGGDEGN
jgi:hypothetical protein